LELDDDEFSTIIDDNERSTENGKDELSAKSVKEITREYQHSLKLKTETAGNKRNELIEASSRPNSVRNFVGKIENSEYEASNNVPVTGIFSSDNLNSRSSGVNLMKEIIEMKCIDIQNESLEPNNKAISDMHSSSSGKYLHPDRIKLNAQNDGKNDVLITKKFDKSITSTESYHNKYESDPAPSTVIGNVICIYVYVCIDKYAYTCIYIRIYTQYI
jgi:hypothetical protein